MKPDEFDRALMDEMAQLPPDPGEAERYNPWRHAMSCLLWGMALMIIQFDFFYLNYLLPLLGCGLCYVGCRSLRNTGRWFRLAWVLSGLRLVFHVAWMVLSATPMAGWAVADPLWNWGLTAVIRVSDLLILFALWRGTRRAFYSGPDRPEDRDWLGLGFLCYLLSFGVALWAELIPAARVRGIGTEILDPVLHYGRIIAFLALTIGLLVCLYRQGEALTGRGYDIVPAPVRLSGGRLLLAVLLVTLIAIPPALWLGSHIPTGPEAPPAALTAEQETVRDRLISLGLPEEVAAALDGAELDRCAGALRVEGAQPLDLAYSEDALDRVRLDGPDVIWEEWGAEARLSSWLVFLPGDQVRHIHWFHYLQTPSPRLQEQFSARNSGYFPVEDFSARLLWERGGETRAVSPQVHLGGGTSLQEVRENLDDYILPTTTLMEAERLGHLRYVPWISFTIPDGAEQVRGYLSYTLDASRFLEPSDIHPDDPENWTYQDNWYVFLRHQAGLLQYPFHGMADLGGAGRTGDYGPIQTVFGHFEYYDPQE